MSFCIIYLILIFYKHLSMERSTQFKVLFIKVLSCPKTHSKGVMVISHLKPKGLKCKHDLNNYLVTGSYQLPNTCSEQWNKILKSSKLNFKTKHPITKIHYPNRLQTQTIQVLTKIFIISKTQLQIIIKKFKFNILIASKNQIIQMNINL